MNILPDKFFTPIQFQERTIKHQILEFADSLLSNPFTTPIVVSSRTYQIMNQQPRQTPWISTAAKISAYSLLFFAPLLALSIAATCFIGKIFLRNSIKPAPSEPAPAIQRTSANTPAEKQNIVKWVQKHLCNQLHLRFSMGISENLPEIQRGSNRPITVRIGAQRGTFDHSFLENIPFFECLMRAKMRETAAPDLITLSNQSPFTLGTLKRLEAIEKDNLSISIESLDPVALDFLGNSLTLNILKKFHNNFQEFQKWILETNGSPRLGELDLTPFAMQAPQIKVASHLYDLSDWDLPDLAPTKNLLYELSGPIGELQVLMQNIDKAKNERRITDPSQLLEKTGHIQNKIIKFLDSYKNRPKMSSYLTVNTLLNIWMNELVQVDKRLQGAAMQHFEKLFHREAPWQSFVTILNLPDPAFDHKQMEKITRSFPNLLWISCHFSQNEPESPLAWIRSWNQNCTHLRVLSLSGIHQAHVNVSETVLSEMKELDIFELTR